MKEDSFSFSLTDFLAYLFPGIIMLVAIAVLIRLSPYKYLLAEIPSNIITGVFLIACAYFVGISISSLMGSLQKPLDKFFDAYNPTSEIPLTNFEDDVKKAFINIFGDHGEWSRSHLYLARTLIREKMPKCVSVIERQSSLRQIRRNIVLPVLFLGVIGIIAGIKMIVNAKQVGWGMSVILISSFGAYVIARTLIKNGTHANRKREVREVCCGLVAYNIELSRSEVKSLNESKS